MPVDLAPLRRLANAARFDEFLAESRRRLAAAGEDAADLLGIGSVYLAFGYLGLAQHCFERAEALLPDDPSPGINLANAALQAGDHGRVRERYARLLARWPNQATLHRNALMSQGYDPAPSEAEHLHAAKAWGRNALRRTGGPQPRPPLRPRAGRPLRVGYVSADFCQHTVGHFLRKVLDAHDPQRVTAHAYAHIQQDDEVTAAIRAATVFCDITALDHADLARKIRADEIDVLVDLSGHTAGSRLLTFVYRPAPVMVSWLGYYATTGLPVMDAVLLDDWHAPPGTEAQFVEPIVRLPGGRFCYTPPAFMPAVVPPPVLSCGHITFGSFNNTAKLNEDVFDLWAEILRRVPDSRLVLKWRTFQDDAMRDKARAAFARRGVDPGRVELRGASFHLSMLEEYGGIDIALDPFPFTGGMTSCEALYLGVPVVTWPQVRTVSRQTWAFLSAIGHPGLAARDAADYVRIAVELAGDHDRLARLRQTLRPAMRDSPLCDVENFTDTLENTLIALFEDIADRESRSPKPTEPPMPKIRVDDIEYDTETLNAAARENLQMLQMTEQEIQRLQLRLAIAQTARNAYAAALKQNLPTPLEQLGETIRV